MLLIWVSWRDHGLICRWCWWAEQVICWSKTRKTERKLNQFILLCKCLSFSPNRFENSSDSGSRTPRRKSFYNFFLRHQDAVDDSTGGTSPSAGRKSVSPNPSIGQPVSASGSIDDKHQLAAAAIKPKRATSFVRKKPPFERGLSAQSALRINKNANVGKWTECFKYP